MPQPSNFAKRYCHFVNQTQRVKTFRDEVASGSTVVPAEELLPEYVDLTTIGTLSYRPPRHEIEPYKFFVEGS